ncbi:MAG: type II toxin-antitoxin system PemK/MazF family toxin [Acidobacteria bacterium]|nr:type II toxin-antitoxin system PemK/MazF family toxin [Acidobacteriota bacterium]
MRRGELYLIPMPSGRDPKRNRVFVIVSRQMLVDSRFSSVICAPVYTDHDGLETQVRVGIDEGLKHESSIHCDELVSLAKSVLTNYIGTLPPEKIGELNLALKAALELEEEVEDEV